jgi:hypothetical protein
VRIDIEDLVPLVGERGVVDRDDADVVGPLRDGALERVERDRRGYAAARDREPIDGTEGPAVGTRGRDGAVGSDSFWLLSQSGLACDLPALSLGALASAPGVPYVRA